MLDESKHFIEWTATEAEVQTAAQLVELQVQLARWQLTWANTWNNPLQRKQLAEQSAAWSKRVHKCRAPEHLSIPAAAVADGKSRSALPVMAAHCSNHELVVSGAFTDWRMPGRRQDAEKDHRCKAQP
jgi:hypothetical protein